MQPIERAAVHVETQARTERGTSDALAAVPAVFRKGVSYDQPVGFCAGAAYATSPFRRRWALAECEVRQHEGKSRVCAGLLGPDRLKSLCDRSRTISTIPTPITSCTQIRRRRRFRRDCGGPAAVSSCRRRHHRLREPARQLNSSSRVVAAAMADAVSDALVIFGVTGDLAYKKIFPALQSLVTRRQVQVPIIGVGREAMPLEQLIERARRSVSERGALNEGDFAKLASQLHYVSGDYHDLETFTKIRQALGGAQRPLFYLAIPPSAFPMIVEHLSHAGCTAGARVVIEKPLGRDLQSAHALNHTAPRFTEESIFRSIIPWARKRCRTSCTSGLRTRFSSRSGIAST